MHRAGSGAGKQVECTSQSVGQFFGRINGLTETGDFVAEGQLVWHFMQHALCLRGVKRVINAGDNQHGN